MSLRHCLSVSLPTVYCLLNLLASLSASADFTLVRDGTPTCTIVTPKEPNHSAAFSAREIQIHIKLITGAELPIVNDAQPVAGPVILVGESRLTRELGLDRESLALQDQEYIIKTLPDVIAILGTDDTGPGYPIVQAWGNWKRVEGRFGSALELSDNRSGFAIVDMAMPDDRGTIELWVNVGWGGGTIFKLAPGNGPNWGGQTVRLEGARLIYNDLSSEDLSSGWHHLMATFDSEPGRSELFIDGVSVATGKFEKTACHFRKSGNLGIVAPPGWDINWGVEGGCQAQIDDFHISDVVRVPVPGGPSNGIVADANSVMLFDFDEDGGWPTDGSGRCRGVVPPDWYRKQATSYAAHDFLERFCGVRWYAPGVLGMEYPTTNTLVVMDTDIRRKPSTDYRDSTSHWQVNNTGLVDEPKAHEENDLYAARMRAGGEQLNCGHSFEGYDDRFYAPNSNNLSVWEGEHKEYFAQGHGSPIQMCFSSTGLMAQVVKDARDFWDGKGSKYRMSAGADFISIVAKDWGGGDACQCETCQKNADASQRAGTWFPKGTSTKLVWGFINEVAKELKKTHPDKWVAGLSYADYSLYPTNFELESTIRGAPCLGPHNGWYAPGHLTNDVAFYKEWVRKLGGARLTSCWIYDSFPNEWAWSKKFTVFPAYNVRILWRNRRMFGEDKIRGLFLCGVADSIDGWLTLRMQDDPELNWEKEFYDFFETYYGPAAEPMLRFYFLVQRTYTDVNNYSEDIRLGKSGAYQDEALAWGKLGTPERMSLLGGFMREAKSLATEGKYKQRLDVFERDVWQKMQEGRKIWLAKQAAKTSGSSAAIQPPPYRR